MKKRVLKKNLSIVKPANSRARWGSGNEVKKDGGATIQNKGLKR